MLTISQIKQTLQKRGMAPLKKLGQNFLVSEGVLKKIAAAADLKKSDVVLEIGPGFGVLTLELASRAAKVVAVEKDKKMAEALEENLAAAGVKNVSVVRGDILKLEAAPLLPDKYKVAANIPYYITSPIIRKFLEKEAKKPELLVLLVQKEVAARICAQPPKMNLLALSVRLFGEPKIVSKVGAGSFYPKPKVDSAILKIRPFEKPPLSLESSAEFFKLARAGFSSPRKQLASNLAAYLSAKGTLSVPKGGFASGGKIGREEIEKIFEKLNLDKKARAENLNVGDWLALRVLLQ